MAEPGAVLPDAPAVPADSQPRRAPKRRRPAIADRLPRWQRLLLIAGGIGIVVAAGVGMSMQSPLPISTVVVQGASADLVPQITSELAITPGQSFASLDSGAVQDRVAAIDGVEDVGLRWTWWNTLTVAITEQEPAGLLADGSGGFLVVDSQAATIRAVAARPAGLIVVEAGNAEDRVLGLQVARQVPADIAPAVDAVVVGGPEAITLRMASGATALLGGPQDAAVKTRLAQQLLTGTGAGAVNVSVPQRPAVGQLPPPPKS